ncbi:HAD-IIA family hydrolase [Corynebacterium alimapuense]|uniref:HAD family hydrolase n=1 Tax=Corynebacterium alimapuense TaxID=1576874 RepID=A0A3M8K793_9CORY|nr:HAD-IIA family hydrolase [Corynebacterium alimapuense]RNE49083.1 HAD family hydrolase [Corynebacterium alimapuense]
MSLLAHYDALLLDLDGTVWEGGRAIDGAVEAISAAGVPAIYVTNNAMRGPDAVAEKLRAIGLNVATHDVLTSAQAAIEMAAEFLEPGDKVYVIGTDSFRNLTTEAGFQVVDSADEQPKAVLQGLNPDLGWRELSEAALSVRGGAKYLVSNLDTTLPSERGLLVGNGSMVAAVISATGVQPSSAGKPGPAMFHAAASKLGSHSPLAVGDRLDTDIQGGNAAGMATFQVLTGVSGQLALIEAPKEQRPTFIAESLADLRLTRNELAPGSQGGFTARIDGSDILLERGTDESTSIQALRTVLEVAWAFPKPVNLIRPMSEAAQRAVDNWW